MGVFFSLKCIRILYTIIDHYRLSCSSKNTLEQHIVSSQDTATPRCQVTRDIVLYVAIVTSSM